MGEGVEFGECLVHRAGSFGRGLGDVVAYDEFALRLHARDQLLQLEGEQAAVRAQLHYVLGDFGGDQPDHLQPLDHRGDVPDRHQVLDLQR